MRSDTIRSRALGLCLGFVTLTCCSPDRVVRFPEGRPTVWHDNDKAPFYTECKPDPEEPGHQLCVPETYVSPFAWDAVDNTVFLPVSRALSVPEPREAENSNDLDEVADSSWFQNRIGRFGMTTAELMRGPCEGGGTLDPNAAASGDWLIDQGKPNGANPGFRVRAKGAGKFMLKADIGGEPERATAAAAIAARLYWAAGYHTPCDSVIYLHPSWLALKPGLTFADNSRIEAVRRKEAVVGSRQRRAARGLRADVGVALAAGAHDRPLHLRRSARRRSERRDPSRAPARAARRAAVRCLAQSLRRARAKLHEHVDGAERGGSRLDARPHPSLVPRLRRLLRQPVGLGLDLPPPRARVLPRLRLPHRKTSSRSAPSSGRGIARTSTTERGSSVISRRATSIPRPGAAATRTPPSTR